MRGVCFRIRKCSVSILHNYPKRKAFSALSPHFPRGKGRTSRPPAPVPGGPPRMASSSGLRRHPVRPPRPPGPGSRRGTSKPRCTAGSGTARRGSQRRARTPPPARGSSYFCCQRGCSSPDPADRDPIAARSAADRPGCSAGCAARSRTAAWRGATSSLDVALHVEEIDRSRRSDSPLLFERRAVGRSRRRASAGGCRRRRARHPSTAGSRTNTRPISNTRTRATLRLRL